MGTIRFVRSRGARRVMVAGAAGLGLIAAGCNLGAPPGTYEVPAERVRSADVNGDGHLDLVTAGEVLDGQTLESDTRGAVLLGDGAGGFTPTVADHGYAARALELADIDGDGNLDRVGLSFAEPENGLYPADLVWQAGDGAGGFGAPVVIDRVEHAGGTTLALGDLDGDGDLDAAAYGDNNVLVWKGDGSGGFGPLATFGNGNQSATANGLDLTVVDIDVDGDDDLVGSGMAGSFGHLDVRLNDGTGAFPTRTQAYPDCGYGTPPHRGAPGSALVFDADEDGDLDLVTICTGQLSLWRSDGAGAFGEPEVLATSLGSGTAATADMDADGHTDVVTGGGHVLYGDGTGAFPRRHRFGGGDDLVVADLTEDGRPDVAVTRVDAGDPDAVVVYPNAL